jgi:two-component system, cell cycle response regulator
MAHILVIEDNPASLELVTYLLQAFGHTVLAATDGESGLALLQEKRVDLIICDLQLPGLNGYDVARQVKEDPALAAIPILAVTAFAMVGDRDRILAAGFDGYIAKPIEAESFVSDIERFLPWLRF